MAFVDLHVLTQSVFYFLACVSGLFVAITTGVNRNRFDGTCILYATFKKEGKDHVMQGSNASNCNFPVYFSVFGLVIYGLALGIYNMYAVCKSRHVTSIGCSSGENTEWTNLATGKKYNPQNYVTFMTVAMIGAWSGFLFQLIQVALGIFRFRRNKRQRGAAAQNFVEAKERAESKTSELDPSPFSG